MKLRHLPSLCAALLVLSPTLATAQTSAVPGFISYQGRVVDAAGANVGAGTPVNRTVIFRIWDNPSSTATANLIYSEAQTVTVSEGEFSVLVGQGVANPTQTFSYSEADKKLADFGTAFNGSARYLGVTVAAAATIATTDNEITPRQQIVSTAFAMRAKFAESIGSSTDLTLTPLSGTASNYGLGWYGTGRLFGSTAVDGPVLYGNAGGALGSNASGTRNMALNWDASGRVGIGASSIASTTNKLTLQGDIATTPADQLTIRGNTDNNKRLNIGFDTTGNQATLQSYTATSTAGNLLLNPIGGNVGIGTTSTSHALTVGGNPGDSQSINFRSFDTKYLNWKGGGAFGGSSAAVIMGESAGIAQIGGHSATLATWRDLTINGGGGNVGIGTGTAAPTAKLDVAGDIKSNGKSVPVAEENLRMVRGSISQTSTTGVKILRENITTLTPVTRGTGWSLNGTTAIADSSGTGHFRKVLFNPPFSDTPTITAATHVNYSDQNQSSTHNPNFRNVTKDGFEVSMAAGYYYQTTWYFQYFAYLPIDFIAIGPR